MVVQDCVMFAAIFRRSDGRGSRRSVPYVVVKTPPDPEGPAAAPLRLVRSRTKALTSSAVIRPPASEPFTCVRSTLNSRASRRTDGGAGMAAPADEEGIAAILSLGGEGDGFSVSCEAVVDGSVGGASRPSTASACADSTTAGWCGAGATAGFCGVGVVA